MQLLLASRRRGLDKIINKKHFSLGSARSRLSKEGEREREREGDKIQFRNRRLRSDTIFNFVGNYVNSVGYNGAAALLERVCLISV